MEMPLKSVYNSSIGLSYILKITGLIYKVIHLVKFGSNLDNSSVVCLMIALYRMTSQMRPTQTNQSFSRPICLPCLHYLQTNKYI